MSLNPAGLSSHNWNHTKENKDDFSLELTGTVVFAQEVQARSFNPNGIGEPRFWDDGNPVFNIRIGVATPTGELKTVTMARAGKAQRAGKKPSLHMQLYNLTNGKGIGSLIGQTIHIWTWPANPTTGERWGQGNPRLYGVEFAEGKYELADELPAEYLVPKLLCNDAVSGGQPVPPAPQYMQVPQQVPQYTVPQPMQQPVYQQHMVQQVPQYAPMPVQSPQQYMQQQPAPQPMHQQPAPQPVQQPVPQPMQQPQGIDPVVAQAMQVQQNQVPLDAYGDVIPF